MSDPGAESGAGSKSDRPGPRRKCGRPGLARYQFLDTADLKEAKALLEQML